MVVKGGRDFRRGNTPARSRDDAPVRRVEPDPDFIADLEKSKGEATVRQNLKKRDRGQKVLPPKVCSP